MNKKEFLEEAGRLAERLFPEPVVASYSRKWWQDYLGENAGLPGGVSVSRAIIEAWANGHPLWTGCKLDTRENLAFDTFPSYYSLTDPALPKPKKYRPWTWADRGLVPDRVISKRDGQMMTIRTINIDSVVLWGCGWEYNWDGLFTHWTQLDGSPCGVEVSE